MRLLYLLVILNLSIGLLLIKSVNTLKQSVAQLEKFHVE